MKHIKILTCPWQPTTGSFDERVLQDFIKDKEVLDIQSQYFEHNQLPHWSFVVTYQMPGISSPVISSDHSPKNGKSSKSAKPDFREQLPESQRPLYDTLRIWRSEKAKAEGVPPYVICTNRQLGDMLMHRPQNLTQFEIIEGFGPAKIEKYGAELLTLLDAPDTLVENEA